MTVSGVSCASGVCAARVASETPDETQTPDSIDEGEEIT